MFEVKHAKAKSFYPVYERKAELQHQTHYCPGCGHGIIHKMVAKAIDRLGIQDRTILVSPVGCSVFAYYYFDVGNIQGAHGRAPAVATAVKRSRPESIVISYQGDGDLSAIGSAEILHAANRGENITVIFVNNAIYGMTGGQMAPTTLLGQTSLTTPHGRDPRNDGYPLHMSELLATLEAPVYIERVALGDNKLIAKADRAIHRAIENQVKGLGFSLVEVLSPCPTIWKKDPQEAQRWVREVLTKTFPVAVLRDRTATATPLDPPPAPPPLENVPAILNLTPPPTPDTNVDASDTNPTASNNARFDASNAKLDASNVAKFDALDATNLDASKARSNAADTNPIASNDAQFDASDANLAAPDDTNLDASNAKSNASNAKLNTSDTDPTASNDARFDATHAKLDASDANVTAPPNTKPNASNNARLDASHPKLAASDHLNLHTSHPKPSRDQRERSPDLQLRIAGFGGQGVLLLGSILAEAGLNAGLEVSWLPSYGPEMRSGTSNCHVRLSRTPIDSPLVNAPDALIAMNEPSLRKFLPTVRPGGWVIFNGEQLPPGLSRPDVRTIARNFSQAANELGDARAANMVMLGALLGVHPSLSVPHIAAALRRQISNPRLLEIDRKALDLGMSFTQGVQS